MSRRRRPRGRPAVPAELTPVAEWGAEPPAEVEPALTVATQPVPPDVSGTDVVPAAESTALTRELADALAKIPACQHCGGRHARACPRVHRMKWHPGGELAEVEFWPDGKWSENNIVWPEDLAEAE